MNDVFVSVKSLIIALLSLVAFSSCTQEEVANNLAPKKPGVVTGKYADELIHNWDSTKSTARDRMIATTTIISVQDGEIVDERKEVANPLMECSIFVTKDDYTIEENELDCSVVSNNILRNQDVKTVENNGKAVADTVVVNMSDGQSIKCPSTITSYTTTDGHEMGTIQLSSAELVSVKNLASGTRTSSYVKAVYNTVYTVKMTYTEKNVSSSAKEFVVYLTTNAIRRVIAEDAIQEVKVQDKKREVVDDNTERCSFNIITTMKSGEIVSVNKSIILNRVFKGIDPYDKFVKSFAFALANVNGIVNGTDKEIKTVDGWTIYGRTDKYSANIRNGVDADAFSTDYSLYHERASFRDDKIEVTFGYEDIRISETKNEVVPVTSDRTGYEKSNYTNGIRTVYIGYTQNITEQVSLYKAARTILGYNFRDGKLVVNDNNVIASVVFVTRYSDGTEETEKVSKTFSRSLKCTSNWKAYENEETQFTHMLNTVLASSDAKRDGGWSWNEETRNITNIARLVGSEQTNSWVASVPNNITFTREGQTYTFDVIKFDVTGDGGKVTLTSEAEEMNVYSYSAAITVSFGNNTVSNVAPGTIIVAKAWTPDFPSEWGKFVSATSTVAVNESNNNWVYTWSLHFTNGTLPVIVGRDAANAVIDQSLFENDTNTKLNGAVYKDNRWMNSIAEDKKHYMLWSNSEGVAQGSMIYATATMWNWNNGHNTVFTSDFTFSVENGGRKLIVKKNGKEFATYRTAAK